MLILGGGIVLGFFLLLYYLLGVDYDLFLFRFEAFVTHLFIFSLFWIIVFLLSINLYCDDQQT